MSADIRLPGALGAWLLEGHAFDAVPLTEDVRWERGEDRIRQLYRTIPQIASVSALWTQAQYDRWVVFWEDETEAGTRSFDCQVKSQTGDALAWWTVQAVAPPQENTLQRGRPGLNRYRVSMQLLLLDGPADSRTAPTLRGSAETTTRLTALLGNDVALRGLAASTTLLKARATQPTIAGAMATTTTLTGYAYGPYLLLENGEALLLEDGELIELET